MRNQSPRQIYKLVTHRNGAGDQSAKRDRSNLAESTLCKILSADSWQLGYANFILRCTANTKPSSVEIFWGMSRGSTIVPAPQYQYPKPVAMPVATRDPMLSLCNLSRFFRHAVRFVWNHLDALVWALPCSWFHFNCSRRGWAKKKIYELGRRKRSPRSAIRSKNEKRSRSRRIARCEPSDMLLISGPYSDLPVIMELVVRSDLPIRIPRIHPRSRSIRSEPAFIQQIKGIWMTMTMQWEISWRKFGFKYFVNFVGVHPNAGSLSTRQEICLII